MTDAACEELGNDCSMNWIKLTNTTGDISAFRADFFCGDHITTSPDGRYLAFAYRTREAVNNACAGGWDIYVIDIEECIGLVNGCGTEKFIQLTDDPADDFSPDWSPDGKSIAFISSRGPYQVNSTDLYIMNADGSDERRFMDNDRYLGEPRDPDWSPDGQELLICVTHFQPDYKFGTVIYSVNRNGIDRKQLTFPLLMKNWNVFELEPQWSPDGKKIVFVSNHEYNGRLYTMNADGTMIIGITPNKLIPSFPNWSPDGEKIAFLDGKLNLLIINQDGSGMKSFVRMVNIESFTWIP